MAIKYDKLNFGTAGIPIAARGSPTAEGIAKVNELGLSGMELEFVHSVNIKEDKTSPVFEAAKKNNVELTCHGSYYINLSSLEKDKIHASIDRVLNAAKIANMCGAKSCVFHAGYYMKRSPKEVYPVILKCMKEIVAKLKDENNPIFVRPETTGKGTQWGELDEIIKLSQELEQVMPCIDFSHIHARSNGKWNTLEEFRDIFTRVEKGLGKKGLQMMHCHISGIAYGEKGEKHHLILKESDMNYKDLLKVFKEFGAKGIVICESPNIEEDALLMKRFYDKL
ncbi:TIM barrel protein [Candidatus Woesearchaeota archaeon]|nr:TIM barrel protein [Candidatus Woesearchaeota archaeon]